MPEALLAPEPEGSFFQQAEVEISNGSLPFPGLPYFGEQMEEQGSSNFASTCYLFIVRSLFEPMALLTLVDFFGAAAVKALCSNPLQ